MECPLCSGIIADGALVCKHCKAQIIKCPNCLEFTDGHKGQCLICESPLSKKNPQENQIGKSQAIQTGEASVYLLRNKKSYAVSLLLNLLWAGWGVYYCDGEDGRWIAPVNILAFLISLYTMAVPSLILFIYASIICYKQVKVYNLELELEVSKGGQTENFPYR